MIDVKKKKMHIGISNRDPSLWPGGDVVVQENYTKWLINLGQKVTTYTSYYFEPKSTDIILSFNINFFWVFTHLLNAKKHKKHFAVFCGNCNVNSPDFQKFIITYADVLLFYSKTEQQALESYLNVKIPDSKCYFLEQGVESIYLSAKTKDKEGVLCVGRIEKRKNQLMLIKACGQLNIPLTIVGFIADQQYYEQCVQESKKYNVDISFLPYVPQNELKQLYATSKVVANVALFEPWGLTVREGGLSNCNALMTKNTYVQRKIPHFWWCDPTSLSSIKTNLHKAYNAPNTLTLQKFIKKMYMWKQQTLVLLNTLEKICSKKAIAISSDGWKEAINICLGMLQYDQEELIRKNTLINELICSNKNKQQAIEELIASNEVKQNFIDKIRHLPVYSLIKKIYKIENN